MSKRNQGYLSRDVLRTQSCDVLNHGLQKGVTDKHCFSVSQKRGTIALDHFTIKLEAMPVLAVKLFII